MIWIGLAVVALLVVCGLLWSIWQDVKKFHGVNDETTFWANKCHEAFNEAQRAYSLEDWYSFNKFCEQHALYYRRYQMARDGHFEKRSNE